MTRELRVRRATSDDTQTLVNLMEEFYAEANFKLDRQWAADAFLSLVHEDDYGCVWIVSMEKEPIGHAVLTVRFTMEHGGLSGYVDDLFVRKEFRRHGAAYFMLLELESECRKRNCKALLVEVGNNNTAGLKTYEKLGLKLIADGRVLYKKPL